MVCRLLLIYHASVVIISGVAAFIIDAVVVSVVAKVVWLGVAGMLRGGASPTGTAAALRAGGCCSCYSLRDRNAACVTCSFLVLVGLLLLLLRLLLDTVPGVALLR